MCRYCKKLNQIKDLREKELKKCINLWRQRDCEARGLIYWMMLELQDPDRVLSDVLVQKAKSFLNKNWIGK